MDLVVLAQKLNTDQSLNESEESWVLQNDPGNVLIVYGSLAPGRDNHHHMKRISGEWKNAVIQGILVDKGWGQHLGYPGLRFEPRSETKDIDCFSFHSIDLGDHIERLDAFEGDDYQRIIIPFQLKEGGSGIGSVYALKD